MVLAPEDPWPYLYLAAVSLALALIDLDVRRPCRTRSSAARSYGVERGAAARRGRDCNGSWAKPRPPRGLLADGPLLFALYLAIAYGYRGGMGLGDVKLAGVLGLHLGWLGWSSVLFVGAVRPFGFLLGGLVGAVLLATRRVARRSRALPFGPFMLTGALIAVFWGERIAAWYLRSMT